MQKPKKYAQRRITYLMSTHAQPLLMIIETDETLVETCRAKCVNMSGNCVSNVDCTHISSRKCAKNSLGKLQKFWLSNAHNNKVHFRNSPYYTHISKHFL